MTTSEAALERTTLRAISWRLLPLIGLGYLVSFMDRVNISFAAPQMNAQLGFTASVYGFGGGLFFISYALLEVPSNLALMRVGAPRWLARIMITWGLIAMATVLIRTPWQFYAMRFALGAAEAGFFPGVIYYLGQWFPQAYRGRAISRFYVAGPLASLLMGSVAGALLGLDGRLGLLGWQWLLLIEGAPALLLALFFWRLPQRPAQAKWLSPDQRDWLEARLAADARATGAPDHSLLRAVLRPQVLAITAANFLMLGSFYAFTLSAPAILRATTGLSPAQVGYVVAFAGLIGAVGMIFSGWNSDRTRERYLHTVVPLAITAAAFAVMAAVHAPGIIIAAYLVALSAYYTVGATNWLIPGEIVHPRALGVSVAAINGVSQLGSFLFPWLWGLAKDATGGFHLGQSLLPFSFLGAAAIYLALRQVRRRAAVTAPT